MSLSRSSVERPIFTLMVTLIVVVLGLVSLDRLQIDMLPAIELPTVTVRTQYEGASPEVMERLVTQILEEIVETVPGVTEISSESSEGSSTLRVTFSWGTPIDTAAIDVQSKIEDEISELPDDVIRPRISKFDVASFPIVILGVSSDLDPVEMTQLIDDHIRQRFARIPGVAQVDLWGEFRREIRIGLDPDRVKALGVSLDTVLDALRDANLDLPAGRIEDGRHEIMLRAPAEFQHVEQIRETVIEGRDGAVVRIGQIAVVEDTYEKLDRLVRVDGQPGIRMAIRKQASANTVEVSQNILAAIEAVNRDHPRIRVTAVSNQGNFIERSIANVAQSILYGGGLAVLVLLFFLRSLRSTVVISLAIPISVVATLALMYFGGFTLNLMTLGGLALGVGMMVDSSVVVLDNIYRRYQEQAESAAVAAVNGAREVAGAILASTITTLVIFMPLVLVRGVSGLLFRELAYVIGFSLICSLLISLSLVPMLASKFLRPASTDGRGAGSRIAAWSGRAFEALDLGYRDLLRGVLGKRLILILGSLLLFVASLFLLPYIGEELLPPSDEGEVRVTGEMEVGTRLGLVDRQTRVMEELTLAEVPEQISSVVTVGASGRDADARSHGQIQLALGPATERSRSNVEIADALRRKLTGQIPGMAIRTRAPQGQFLLQRILGGDEGLEVEVRGYDLDTLGLLARQVAADIVDVSGVTDVEVSREAGTPQQEIQIDREKAADLGLSVRDVTEVLETAVAGTKVGEFRSAGNSYRILVQLEDAETRSMDEILDLTLSTASGAPVALRNLVTSRTSSGPQVIERKDQQRLVVVRANVMDRPMGSVASEVQQRLDRIPRPAGFALEVAGNFEEQQEAFQELLVSLVLALALVYMVLACQYESFRDPLVVMLTVPLAAIGVLVTLFLTRTTLNVQSYVGCIMLSGIVVNNAILLVDQAGHLLRSGRSAREAMAEAGRRRLRPILMTSLTTILALMPLALGIGEGAEAQAPLARTVVGGLFGSSLITLVLIPAVYSLIHTERSRRRRAAGADQGKGASEVRSGAS